MHWGLLLAAAATLTITMGARQTTGLFVSPIHQQTGIGIAAISFALAIGQFTWGAVQPIFGAIADKRGSTGVLVLGAVLLSLGLALTPHLTSPWGLTFTLGLLT
ncbi:MAG: MFS transporter, partial [Archangium gephyra]